MPEGKFQKKNKKLEKLKRGIRDSSRKKKPTR